MMDGPEGGALDGLGSGVMLGLQALERQQAELEQRRAAAAAAALAHAAFQEQASVASAQQSDATNTQRSLQISEDDQDSNTAPSSTMNSSSVVGSASAADNQIGPLPPKDSSLMRSTSFGKFFRTPLVSQPQSTLCLLD
jgi:hypothetical protein